MFISGVQFSSQEVAILRIISTPTRKLTLSKVAKQLGIHERRVKEDLDRMYEWRNLKGWGDPLVRLAVWAARQPELK